MIKYFKKISLFLLLFASAAHVKAQATGIEEFMYRSGKVYTFLGVAGIVLLGILFYLMRMDLKLTKLEKQIEEQD